MRPSACLTPPAAVSSLAPRQAAPALPRLLITQLQHLLLVLDAQLFSRVRRRCKEQMASRRIPALGTDLSNCGIQSRLPHRSPAVAQARMPPPASLAAVVKHLPASHLTVT